MAIDVEIIEPTPKPTLGDKVKAACITLLIMFVIVCVPFLPESYVKIGLGFAAACVLIWFTYTTALWFIKRD